jgi:hypothetical protein
MGLTNFDELNTLSTTETTKDDRRKAIRKKIPIHDYFENMQISEEEKEKRVRLANLLLADVLFLFALSRRNRDTRYLSETFQKRYISSVKKVTEPDQKMQRYIRKVCNSIVKTTLKSGKDDGKKQGEALTDSDVIKVSQDSYAVSLERATSVAENEANTILNGEEYSNAVKNGCTRKRWKSYRDERVRADHADVDGQVVDISRPFRVGKYMMMYPKDDSLGAGLEEIVNCRCSVEYIKTAGAWDTYTGKFVKYNENASYQVDIPEYSDKINKMISASAKKVAQYGSDRGYEYSSLIDLETGEEVDFGTSERTSSVDYYYPYIRQHKGGNFVMVHNHNTESGLSLPDIQELSSWKEIEAIVSVTNNGIINVAVSNGVKSGEYLQLKYEDIARKMRSTGNSLEIEQEMVQCAVQDFVKEGIRVYGK